MRDQISFLAAAVRGDRAGPSATFIGELPRLSRGSLADADLGVRCAGGLVVCTAHFEAPMAADVRTRLEFWAWTVGATVPDAAGAALAPAALSRCDRVLRGIPPHLLRVSALTLITTMPHASAPVGVPLAVRVDLGDPSNSGIGFDRVAATLFLPSPRRLPVGDEILLRVLPPGGTALEGDGMVIQARNAGSGGPGSPAGLLIALTDHRAEVLEAVEAHADLRRRAPRYALQAPATLTVRSEGARPDAAPHLAPEHCECHVENLSQGGAYVRTGLALASGTRVVLALDLPGGSSLSVPAVVAHRDAGGLGLRFEADAAMEAAVARTVEEVVTRPRRALVVDDDSLGRRIVGDALAERGFEVFASCDGHSGLEALIERILDLDVLVTDLRMPGIDGEQLLRTIRGAGGERDLAIVVVSAHLDPSLEDRLLAAGADAVLPKARGGAAIGDAAEQAVLRRRCGAGRPPATAGLETTAVPTSAQPKVWPHVPSRPSGASGTDGGGPRAKQLT